MLKEMCVCVCVCVCACACVRACVCLCVCESKYNNDESRNDIEKNYTIKPLLNKTPTNNTFMTMMTSTPVTTIF